SDVAGCVAHDHFEDAKAGTPRRPNPRGDDLADDGRVVPRTETPDRHQARAVFVSERKPEQEIFDDDETGAGEIGGASRADAAKKTERRCQELGGRSWGAWRARGARRASGTHWMMVTAPGCRRTSRMLAGRSNGLSS